MEGDKKVNPRTTRGKIVCYLFIQAHAANLKSLIQYNAVQTNGTLFLNPTGDTNMLSAQGFISHTQFSPSKSIHFVLYNPFYTLAKVMAR